MCWGPSTKRRPAWRTGSGPDSTVQPSDLPFVPCSFASPHRKPPRSPFPLPQPPSAFLSPCCSQWRIPTPPAASLPPNRPAHSVPHPLLLRWPVQPTTRGTFLHPHPRPHLHRVPLAVPPTSSHHPLRPRFALNYISHAPPPPVCAPHAPHAILPDLSLTLTPSSAHHTVRVPVTFHARPTSAASLRRSLASVASCQLHTAP